MKSLLIAVASIVVVSACAKSTSPETVDSLAANPEHLKEVMAWCKEDSAKVGKATCVAASEAWRRRFIGSGQPQYTPKH
jgi:hypothetical protein